MVMAIVLVVIVIGSVIFHIVTPWWTTELASNWKSMDDTLTITLLITGLFFVVINLFVVYTLVKFRHRADRPQKASYQPENKRLERWLIGVTTVGIVALLAPGLVVYAKFVTPPDDATVLEVVASQWQWRYRLPGESGKLGGSDARFVSGSNPLGLDPDDPATADNIVILANEVHLPVNKPVKVIARSHDVLHDFFVPPMRARMNIVPGQVSSFWFTPTKVGRYEAMCAQLCGTGHANMRGVVVVEDEATYMAWLQKQPTFAATQSLGTAMAAGAGGDPVALGKTLAQTKGCIGCHSIDGSAGVGPTWKGLFGKTETLADGSTMVIDDAALKREIADPAARVIKGYSPIMPKTELTDEEVDALAAYIKAQ
ncbi:c-type cytochrome [Piscinibacter sakaiensis]|uniref:cytochrome c oxidase subunit II n=1 Tax=Piscinibacter sakaiensis TaxID=1547922 RepID=UPI003AB0C9B4